FGARRPVSLRWSACLQSDVRGLLARRSGGARRAGGTSRHVALSDRNPDTRPRIFPLVDVATQPSAKRGARGRVGRFNPFQTSPRPGHGERRGTRCAETAGATKCHVYTPAG